MKPVTFCCSDIFHTLTVVLTNMNWLHYNRSKKELEGHPFYLRAGLKGAVIFHQKFSDRWRKDKTTSRVGVHALWFLQCFMTLGFSDRKHSQLIKAWVTDPQSYFSRTGRGRKPRRTIWPRFSWESRQTKVDGM